MLLSHGEIESFVDQTGFNETRVFNRLNRLIQTYWEEQRSGTPVDYKTPFELLDELELDSGLGEQNWNELFTWVEKYLKFAVKTGHPRFVNRMWSAANLPSIVGEIVSAISNTSACTYESAPVSTLIEKFMINEMLDLVGFSGGEGQMTTGSSNANMIAMMAARDKVNLEIKQKGLSQHPQLYAFVGAESHYSMDKAAAILGIGTDHLLKVPLNENGEMDTARLQGEIEQTERNGGIPFFVGATAGTTVRGAYDSLPALIELQKNHPFWLHVDGAWGGSAVLSPYLKKRFLRAIEKVDSFTFDFHKMPGTNLICNILLINKQSGVLRQSCAVGDTSYIFRDESKEEEFNLGTTSLQCGRKVDSLKWFLDWKFYGRDGFALRIERYLQLAGFSERIVEETPELEMVVPRESFNVCFRYKVPLGIPENEFNLQLRTRLHREGIGLIGFGYIGSDLCLRLLITDPGATEESIRSLFRDIVNTGNSLLEAL